MTQLFSKYYQEDQAEKKSGKGLFSKYYEDVPSTRNDVDSYVDRWLPDFMKQAYNESMTGLIHQVAAGEQVFDLEGYDPTVLEEFGAGLVSFFMPVDLGTFFITGGVGSFAAKKAGSLALRQMVKSGVKEDFAKKTIAKGMASLQAQSLTKASGGATALGTYGGLNSILRQKIESGDVDLGEAGKEAVRMAAVGAITGGVAGRAAFKGTSPAMKLLQETGAFGTAEPALRGEIPTPMDYVHAGSTILGIKGVTKVGGTGLKAVKERVGERKTPIATTFRESFAPPVKAKKASGKFLTDVSKKVQESRREEAAKQQIWRSKRKGFQNTEIVGERTKKGTGLELFQIKDTVSGKTLELSKNKFYKEFDLYDKPLTQKSLVSKKLSDIARLSKALVSKKYGFSKDFLSETKGQMFGNKDLRSRDMTPRQAFEYRERLKKERELVNIKKELKPTLMEFEPGKTLLQRIFPEKWINPFLAAESRLKRSEAKNLGGMIAVSDARRAEIVGTFVEKGVGQSGLRTYKDPVAVSYALEGARGAKDYFKLTGKKIPIEAKKIATKVRKELDKAIKIAEKAGIDVAGYLDNYYPRMMKTEIQNIIWDDALSYMQKNKKLLEKNIYKRKDLKILNNMIKRSLNAGEFNKHTSKAIKKLVSESKLTYKEALEYLRNESSSEMFSPFGNIEKKRKYDLPADFYERNAKEVLVRYFNKLSKRVGQAEVFGARGEKAKALLKRLKSSPEEHRVMQEIYNNFTGLSSVDPAYQLSPTARKLTDAFMSFEYGTKIGLGFATVPNVTQSLISSVTEAGFYRFAKASIRLLDPQVRERIKKSGATWHNVMDMMLGTDFGINPGNWRTSLKKLVTEKGINNRLANVSNLLTTATGFKGINHLNQMLAASTAEVYVKDLHRIVRNASKNIKTGKDRNSIKAKRYAWATRNLARLGIEKKSYSKAKLSEGNYEHAMYRFAKESQLQKDILKDPLVFNNPKYRPLFIFKRFAFRQAKYQKDLLKREVFDHGNVLVPLRLAAGGMLGVGLVKGGIDNIKRFFSGEDVVRDDPDGFFDNVIDAIATVGGMGFFSDLLSAEDKLRAILWALNPVLFSDIGKFTKGLAQFTKNVGTFGLDSWIGFQRSIKGFAPLFGGFTKELAKRAETTTQKEQRLSQEKGEIRKKAFEYMRNDEHERAWKLVEEWNSANQVQKAGKYITPDDINYSEFIQYIIREEKKKANP